jgi:hypothetical protein
MQNTFFFIDLICCVFQSQLWIALEKVSAVSKQYKSLFDWLQSYLPQVLSKIMAEASVQKRL